MPRAAPLDAGATLAAYLDERAGELRQLVPRALQSAADVKATHHVRVTTRRLKAAIDLLEPLLPDRPRRQFARTLRLLRRKLGPARDADVMLGHVMEMRARAVGGGRKSAIDWLYGRLDRHRAELVVGRADKPKIPALLRQLDGWSALSRRIHLAEHQARSLLVQQAPVRLAEFVDRSHRVAQLDLAANPDATEDVHALRIAGKLLRYTLELCEPTGIRLPAAVLRKFKRLQDALGMWHDYAALGEQVLRFALDDELALHRPGLYGQVLNLARSCLNRGNVHLRAFARFWQREGDALAETIRQSFASAAADQSNSASSERAALRPLIAMASDTTAGAAT